MVCVLTTCQIKSEKRPKLPPKLPCNHSLTSDVAIYRQFFFKNGVWRSDHFTINVPGLHFIRTVRAKYFHQIFSLLARLRNTKTTGYVSMFPRRSSDSVLPGVDLSSCWSQCQCQRMDRWGELHLSSASHHVSVERQRILMIVLKF